MFETVEEWIKRFDIPAKVAAGAVDTYVYTVRYGRNNCLAHGSEPIVQSRWGGRL